MNLVPVLISITQRLLELEDRESSLYDKVQSLQTENDELLSAVTTSPTSHDDSGYEDAKEQLEMAEKVKIILTLDS